MLIGLSKLADDISVGDKSYKKQVLIQTWERELAEEIAAFLFLNYESAIFAHPEKEEKHQQEEDKKNIIAFVTSKGM
jgi:hypothetical protein